MKSDWPEVPSQQGGLLLSELVLVFILGGGTILDLQPEILGGPRRSSQLGVSISIVCNRCTAFCDARGTVDWLEDGQPFLVWF